VLIYAKCKRAKVGTTSKEEIMAKEKDKGKSDKGKSDKGKSDKGNDKSKGKSPNK
jgi:hypothetical protein